MSAAYKVIYKITFLNGRIYVGKEPTDTLNYFGSGQQRHRARLHAREQRGMLDEVGEMLGAERPNPLCSAVVPWAFRPRQAGTV